MQLKDPGLSVQVALGLSSQLCGFDVDVHSSMSGKCTILSKWQRNYFLSIVDHDIKDPTETCYRGPFTVGSLEREFVFITLWNTYVGEFTNKLNSKFCNEELDSWNSQSHVY